MIRILKKALAAVIMLLFLFPQPALASKSQDYDYVLDKNVRVPIPRTYKADRVISYLGEEIGYMKGAEDLFIDRQGILYVADTGNNRVLKMTGSGEVLGVFTGPKEKPMKSPRGVYVDDDGDIYVADTENGRVLHLSPYGDFVEEFTRPESDLLHETVSFDPNKVFISSTGYLYVIRGRQFMMIDAYNRFRGYAGADQVGFSLNDLLVRIFASDEQKSRLQRREPPSYINFVIHEDGMIYAVSAGSSNQIKKLNSVGKNIYPSGQYGEVEEDAEAKEPAFADIAVDRNGIISVLDWKLGKVYQYDQEGNLLTVFGGIGAVKGKFESPSSLVVDRDGNIYVLDRGRNNIQVFAPTKFIRDVHEAVMLYANGDYAEALVKWEEVLKTDANYTLAHRGIAKALYKDEEYLRAMEEYRIGDDQEGYSLAFEEYRHEFFRGSFGLLVLAFILLIYILYKVFMLMKKAAKKEQLKDTVWHGEVI
ncbi:MAG TPA: hypothetical protein GX505_12525 [Clostridiales bacterium]|nr:hypothetical protein [Clostridiales bacterium]